MNQSKTSLINVKIKGITPLLMHKFSDESYNGKPAKDDLPREIAEKFAYRNDDGELYIPGDAIYAAIINAGKFHQLKKNKITTTRSTLIPAFLTIKDTFCLLGTKDFEVDSRPVVNQAVGGARIISHRPRLDEWSTSFVLDIDTSEISENTIRQIVDDAGRKCGLLSFRPERKGRYGQYVVTKWEKI